MARKKRVRGGKIQWRKDREEEEEETKWKRICGEDVEKLDGGKGWRGRISKSRWRGEERRRGEEESIDDNLP